MLQDVRQAATDYAMRQIFRNWVEGVCKFYENWSTFFTNYSPLPNYSPFIDQRAIK